MSRALGDKILNRILNRVPECYPVVLGEDSVILIGTDGILDPTHKPDNQTIATMMNMLYQGVEAERFVEYALERKTGDNATAIVVKFDKEAVSVEPPFSNVIQFPSKVLQGSNNKGELKNGTSIYSCQ